MLFVFTLINGVLTLPGIAALMLGVGMAVDANILTYERIREELRVGKSVKTSFQAGAKQAFTAILGCEYYDNPCCSRSFHIRDKLC